MRKKTRTISGVTPLAVMSKPAPCPGACIYCPTFINTPQSYTPQSPAVLRAAARNFDPCEQVKLRLDILGKTLGHPTEKIELIIMGGTFLATSLIYQEDFIKRCLDGLNGVDAASLEEAQIINETSKNRCVGMCFETRPDVCSDQDVARMVRFGATRVELGVQLPDDEVYQLVQRGHTVSQVKEATCRLKEAGLKVHYHFMPGLPGSTPQKDLKYMQELFSNQEFCPDGLKIYPLMVVEGTILEQWWQQGRYTPYDNQVMINLICDIKDTVPKYVRISRVLRDIPVQFIKAGLKDSLRLNVRDIMASRGQVCRCIRCREIGHRLAKGYKLGSAVLKQYDYLASGGQELFLSFEDEQDTLFGLLRLRLQYADIKPLLKPQLPVNSDMNSSFTDLSKAKIAMVRELHVYGAEIALGAKEESGIQHKGYGKALLSKAEKIAKEQGFNYMAVLSGIGAREYYRACGYSLFNGYMLKTL
ncbi:MAG: tRNA uridine(34) 5-carboxymethylaminomethyl modification radical SAM/GNAT enzyme Elp3 [Chloroflexi bacterium]|nr:tRNA uridine(34) 5-carboxymethylaminomethyl modification radical SAM/GNAT enzyme Elp3 [Chloroflexota bacterium]